jgi:hypothetical protein
MARMQWQHKCRKTDVQVEGVGSGWRPERRRKTQRDAREDMEEEIEQMKEKEVR